MAHTMSQRYMADLVDLVGASLRFTSDYWALRADGETLTTGERGRYERAEIADAVQAYFGSHPNYAEFYDCWFGT